MSDFETHPVGTAARLEALDAAPELVLNATMGAVNIFSFGLQKGAWESINAMHGKRVRLVLVEG